MSGIMVLSLKSRTKRSWIGRSQLKGKNKGVLYLWNKLMPCRLVENPITISVKDLIQKYTNVTYPVTFVCAGNRRKEQNIVRKTKGFSWGAAGVSTSLWTGIAMADVIRTARPLRKARFVCMEGAAKLPNGCY